MSYECNNIKLAIWNDKSEVVCAMCKKCLITANHDVYVLNYVNDINSLIDNQNTNVSNIENQKKHKEKVKKSKNLGSKERLASPMHRKHITCLRWLPTGRTFYISGKVIQYSDSECHCNISESDNACAFNHQEPTSKQFPNSTSFLGRKNQTASHKPKPVPNSKQRLHLLCMDLCGPMRIKSVNTKWYVLVIVDDYSRYTWVHFLRSKDEAPEVLKAYFDSVGISHQTSSVRTPQQNGVVERRNQILVEDARITKKIIETMNVTFDVLSTMAFEQRSLKPELQGMTSGPMHDDYIGGQPLAALSSSSDSESSDSKCIYNNCRLYTDTTNSSSQAPAITLHKMLTSYNHNHNMFNNKIINHNSNLKQLHKIFKMQCSMRLRS
ncbi:retrovirus-related pol polyprotein from transposon TNT 1-94 [Tanacetum coccineum]